MSVERAAENNSSALRPISVKAAFHDIDTDTDILARILVECGLNPALG